MFWVSCNHRRYLTAVKSIGKEFLSQSIPELLEVASKKKTPKQAIRSAVHKTVKKQLGGSKREEANDSFDVKSLHEEVGQIFSVESKMLISSNALPIETSHTSLDIFERPQLLVNFDAENWPAVCSKWTNVGV